MSESTSNVLGLKPGQLVALRTVVTGGVHYQRRDLTEEEIAKRAAAIEATGGAGATDGAEVEAWETVKVTVDADEHARAVKARRAARKKVEKVCIESPFGLICPQARCEELRIAIDEAKEIARLFNASAQTCRIDFWAMRGQIVESDTDAARAIASEIKGLLAEMQAGITARDAERIRAAADKGRALATMLDEEHAAQVTKSVKDAREAAREIFKHVSSGGDVSLALVADTKLQDLRRAEQAFLDLSVAPAVEETGALAAAAAAAGAGALDIDLGGDGDAEETGGAPAPAPASDPAAAIDLDESPGPEAEPGPSPSPIAVDLDLGEGGEEDPPGDDVDASRAVDADAAASGLAAAPQE